MPDPIPPARDQVQPAAPFSSALAAGTVLIAATAAAAFAP